MQPSESIGRGFVTSLLILLFVPLVSCSTLTPEEASIREKKLLQREIETEVAIGREMAARLFGHFGRPPNAGEAVRYINLVGLAIASEFGRSELSYRFAILSSQSANAMAAPGGYIFITTGLLARLSNESELAVVLAHEIGHVNQKHMYEAIRANQENTGAGIFSMISRGGATLGKSISKIAEKGMEILIKGGLNQEQEISADRAGLLYAVAIGYDADSFREVLKKLTDERFGIERTKAAQKVIQMLGDGKRLPASKRTFLETRFRSHMQSLLEGDQKKEKS